MTRWLRALGLAGATACAGCAFSLSGPKPDRPRDRIPECDTSKALVGLDATVATVLGVAALGLIGNDEAGVALLPLAIGGLYAGGAVAGSGAVDRCREAVDEFNNDYAREHQVVVDEPPLPPRRAASPPPTLEPGPVAPVPAVAPSVPPPVVPVSPPPPVPAKAPAPAPASDTEWSAFWKEVP